MNATRKKREVTIKTIEVVPAPEENISSYMFHRSAKDYLCYFDNFKSKKFSPVPFALLCEAIELELKSRLMKDLPRGPKQPAMKDYGHDLEKAYNKLKPSEKVLTPEQLKVLRKINVAYKNKGLHYVEVANILSRRFPGGALADLRAVAAKLLALGDADPPA
jgi:hypothetical protein